MSSPTADVSCRVAWADDADAIAAVQVRAWRTMYADLLPANLLSQLDQGQIAEGWRISLGRPEDARQRVLIALERNLVSGFAITCPSPDPDADNVADGEISDLTIDPHQRGKGHGSRLLQACVDTLKADRFAYARAWVGATDDETRKFFVETGWDSDGAHRTLDLTGDGSVTLKQVRLHTDLGA